MSITIPKTYFLCPPSAFLPPPPTGPLTLGSIIRSTSSPQYPLNKASIPPIPEASLCPPDTEHDWKKTVSTTRGTGLGVYAQFLQLATGGGGLVLGPEASVNRSTRNVNTFAFDAITTLSFDPAQEYVQEAVKAPAVQAWLREPRQKFAFVSELFLVTGLKLVRGARIRYSTARSVMLGGKLGVDATSRGVMTTAAAVKIGDGNDDDDSNRNNNNNNHFGVGVGMTAVGTSLGARGYWTSVDEDVTESHRESEFVFAFRVKRLRFGRRLRLEDYTKGAFMAVGGEEADDDECVLVEDVDGADIQTAEAVSDVTENGNVYCVPP